MKNICVFCSANDVEEKYVTAAKEMASLIAKHGYGLVWGGTNRGLMKVIADSAQESGGKIVGVTIELLSLVKRRNADEMSVVKDIPQRKTMLIEKSDAIVLLVGGTGSLDEVTEVLELKKHNLCNHPVVVLNTDNFYDGFRTQLQKMKEEGFIKKSLDELIYFADTPQTAIEYITNSLS